MERQSTIHASTLHHESYSSAPRVQNAHLFKAGARHMLLSVKSGKIYELNDILAETIDRAMDYGDSDRVSQFLATAGISETAVLGQPPVSVPVHALSLAVAQKCNLGCSYCYAQQGNFGGPESSMSIATARAAVDRLLAGSTPGHTVSLTFLGGEPLANRTVLRAATAYAAERAAATGVEIAFALTTNATLITEKDADFFEHYSFTVTVSVDGIGKTNDRLRPFKSGLGSYDCVIERSRLMLSRVPRRSRVIARVTVTPRNLRLVETLDGLIELGFDGVHFSPVLSSPTGNDQMGEGDFDTLLAQLIECSRIFEQRLRRNELYPFLNIINTLRRIHNRQPDAYPCGAGGGYLGVSATGGLYACHRFVNEEQAAMGNVVQGVDNEKQRLWLLGRNVHSQQPCQTCWARYLCSGGCHHEAIHRGRPACDYIRGWLHYCLGLYGTLINHNSPLLARVLSLHPTSVQKE